MNRIPTLVAAPAAPATPAFEAATPALEAAAPALEAAAPALEAVTPAVAVKGARRLMTCHCLAKAFPCSTYSRLINLRPLQLNSDPPSLSLSLSLSLSPLLCLYVGLISIDSFKLRFVIIFIYHPIQWSGRGRGEPHASSIGHSMESKLQPGLMVNRLN